jgi:hypothetical protein
MRLMRRLKSVACARCGLVDSAQVGWEKFYTFLHLGCTWVAPDSPEGHPRSPELHPEVTRFHGIWYSERSELWRSRKFGGNWWDFGGNLVGFWWKFGENLVKFWWEFGGNLV